LGHPTDAAAIPQRLVGVRAEGRGAFIACDADGLRARLLLDRAARSTTTSTIGCARPC